MTRDSEIEGTDGNDTLTGTSGANRLDLNHSNDVLNGGAGNDSGITFASPQSFDAGDFFFWS